MVYTQKDMWVYERVTKI